MLLVVLLVLSSTLVCVAFSPHPALVCHFRHKHVGLRVSNLQESAPTAKKVNICKDDETTSVQASKVKEQKGPFTTATVTVKPDYASVDNRLETNFIEDDAQDDSIRKVLGVPQWLKQLPKGESLYVSRQVTMEGETTHAYSIQRVSSRPPIFVLRGILTSAECHDIAQEASRKTATPAQTRHNQGATARPHSSVVWLNHWDSLAETVAQSSVALETTTTTELRGWKVCKLLLILHKENMYCIMMEMNGLPRHCIISMVWVEHGFH